MKKILQFIYLLFPILMLAQAPAIQWQKNFGGSAQDHGRCILKTFDGGFLIVGYTTSTDGDISNNSGNSDIWVVKTNASGNIEWQKTYGGSGDDFGMSVVTTNDGGYALGCYTNSTNGDIVSNHGFDDYMLLKISASGNKEWAKTYGGSGTDICLRITQTSDSGFALIGRTDSTSGDITQNLGGNDYWLVKTDVSGNLEWQKSFGGSGSDIGEDVIQTTDGYLISGFSSSNNGQVSNNHGADDVWVVKIDNSGNIQWQKTYGGTSSDFGYRICKADTGYVISATVISANGNITINHGGMDFWVFKIDESGNLIWQKSFGGNGTDLAGSIVKTADGGYLVGGHSSSQDNGIVGHGVFADYWLVKLDDSGVLQWQKSLGGTESDQCFGIIQTPDGGFAAIGNSKSTDGDITSNYGSFDIWLVKLFPENLATNEFQNVGISVFPNPATSQLQIKLAETTQIEKIAITDVLGKTVFFQSGSTSIINIENLASGTYFLQAFSAGKQFQTKFIKQ